MEDRHKPILSESQHRAYDVIRDALETCNEQPDRTIFIEVIGLSGVGKSLLIDKIQHDYHVSKSSEETNAVVNHQKYRDYEVTTLIINSCTLIICQRTFSFHSSPSRNTNETQVIYQKTLSVEEASQAIYELRKKPEIQSHLAKLANQDSSLSVDVVNTYTLGIHRLLGKALIMENLEDVIELTAWHMANHLRGVPIDEQDSAIQKVTEDFVATDRVKAGIPAEILTKIKEFLTYASPYEEVIADLQHTLEQQIDNQDAAFILDAIQNMSPETRQWYEQLNMSDVPHSDSYRIAAWLPDEQITATPEVIIKYSTVKTEC